MLEAGGRINSHVIPMTLVQIHIQCASSRLCIMDTFTMTAPICRPQQMITPFAANSLIGQEEKILIGDLLGVMHQNHFHFDYIIGMRKTEGLLTQHVTGIYSV